MPKRLFGPSLRNELSEGEALAIFYRAGLKELGDKVEKRMAKLIQI